MPALPKDEALDAQILDLVHQIGTAALDRKALDLRAYDVRKVVTYSDYFMICAGRSDRQVRAIAEGIVEDLKAQDRKPLGVEGMQQGMWVLIDYGDVIVHVFHEEEREEYDIERLWSGAPRVELALEEPASAPPSLVP